MSSSVTEGIIIIIIIKKTHLLLPVKHLNRENKCVETRLMQTEAT